MKLKKVLDQDSELCFTSLIDIVFLLLIFFMCSARFKQVDQRLDAFLPGIERINPPPIEPTPERLSIFVKDDAVSRQSPNHSVRALRQAMFYPMSRDARPISDLNELRGVLARLSNAQPDTHILIAPYDENAGKDQLVPFFNIVAVLDTCKAVGLENVAFQAPAQMME